MRKAITIAALLFVLAIPSLVMAQPGGWPPPSPRWREPGGDLSGTWFMHGDPDKPTYIEQRGPNEALFTNEKGDRAWGSIEGDRVWIPDWSDGRRRGLEGVLRPGRIVWPNGTYWSRRPEGPYWPR
jgi:hypothetical protein